MGNALGSFQRPVLIILDRNFDLATPLHHTWTYQALIHDVFNLNLNKVELTKQKTPAELAATSSDSVTTKGQAETTTKVGKTYDLSLKDTLWRQQKGNPFPVVAESIQEELEKYKQYDGKIKNLKDSYESEGADGGVGGDSTNRLTKAISSLPELTEMKRLLDMHTNIATGLLDHIKQRKLDTFFESEEKLIAKSTLEKSILELINDRESGTCEDKLRLFIIYYLCCATLGKAELDQYLIQLREAGCDIECIKYIKRYKSLLSNASYGGNAANQSNDANQSSAVNKFSNLLSKSAKFAMDGVKNLVVRQNKFPITRIADNLIEHKSSPDTDDYRYFDPKLINGTGGDVHRSGGGVGVGGGGGGGGSGGEHQQQGSGTGGSGANSDAVVFVIGGGNYIEYQNLLDNAKAKSTSTGQTRRVIYGCTEMMNATQLVSQLTKLGQEMS